MNDYSEEARVRLSKLLGLCGSRDAAVVVCIDPQRILAGRQASGAKR